MPEVIHIFSEQDSKGSLLAEVHRLQSSLAAMRQARDFHGANSAERMRQVDRLQEEVEGIRGAYDRASQMFTCPVCYFTGMQHPPMDYNICECCGTEFGLDDEFKSHEELRNEWILGGAKWFFRTSPVGWNPWAQLMHAARRARRHAPAATEPKP